MRLDWTEGTPLFCRRCQAEVPHYVRGRQLRDTVGHEQHPYNAVLSLSVEEEVDPAIMLLPQRSWSAPYVQKRYRLLLDWKNLNHGT
jgi:hypothetical protein